MLYHLGQCYVQQRRPAEAAGVWAETLAMGGDARVEPIDSEGTRFVVSFPREVR